MPRLNPLWAGVVLNLLIAVALVAGLYRLNERVDRLASAIAAVTPPASRPGPTPERSRGVTREPAIQGDRGEVAPAARATPVQARAPYLRDLDAPPPGASSEPAAVTRVREAKRAGFARGRELCEKLGLTEERDVIAVASLIAHVRDFQRAQEDMRAQGSWNDADMSAYVEAEAGDIKAQMKRLPLSQAEIKQLVGEEPALEPFASL